MDRSPLTTSDTRRRAATIVAAVGTALSASTLAVPVTPAAGATGPCWGSALTDVDGGGPDVVVGLPSYDLPGKPDAGAIVVFSDVAAPNSTQPRPPSARRLLTADSFAGQTARAGARFGAAVVAGSDGFGDQDGCADLWVGAPGDTVTGLRGAGQVYLLQGSTHGLTLDHTINLAGLSESEGPQADAGFGSALAAESATTPAIGEPGRDISGVVDAGRVIRLDNLSSEDGADYSVVQQGGDGAGSPERGDRFGEVLDLAATGVGTVLFVGVPHEDVGSRVDAGAVAMDPRVGPLTMVTQDSAGAAGAAEAGDRYGASVDVYSSFEVDHPIEMVVIGVPGEDLGPDRDAGMVSFASAALRLDGDPSVSPLSGRAVTHSQDTAGVPGRVEVGDAYGASVLTGEFGTVGGHQRVVASAPREDLGAAADAGLLTMTTIREEDATPVPGSQPSAWTQDSPGVAGAAESGDRFASALSAVLLTTHVTAGDESEPGWPVILATVPGEDIGTVADAGLAYLGVAPGAGSVQLVLPVAQHGAGIGMAPMKLARGDV